jgi:hypothetical protein
MVRVFLFPQAGQLKEKGFPIGSLACETLNFLPQKAHSSCMGFLSFPAARPRPRHPGGTAS